MVVTWRRWDLGARTENNFYQNLIAMRRIHTCAFNRMILKLNLFSKFCRHKNIYIEIYELHAWNHSNITMQSCTLVLNGLHIPSTYSECCTPTDTPYRIFINYAFTFLLYIYCEVFVCVCASAHIWTFNVDEASRT